MPVAVAAAGKAVMILDGEILHHPPLFLFSVERILN
jgi:hypothetical protein